MLELGNVLKTTYGAWVITGTYTGIGNSTEVSDDDTAVATIQHLLRGETADGLLNLSYANETISTLQGLDAAATAIGGKLARMEELAEQAASGTYSDEELADMQQEFEGLAEGINDIVESTEYNGNKLFGADGESISISIGNGSSIDIVAKDLSIDIEGLDLTTQDGAEDALESIERALRQSDYYSGYISKQIGRLEDFITLIEYEINNALGFEPEDFDTGFAEQLASYAASQSLDDMSVLFSTQANVMPERVLQLLEEYSQQDIV